MRSRAEPKLGVRGSADWVARVPLKTVAPVASSFSVAPGESGPLTRSRWTPLCAPLGSDPHARPLPPRGRPPPHLFALAPPSSALGQSPVPPAHGPRGHLSGLPLPAPGFCTELFREEARNAARWRGRQNETVASSRICPLIHRS
ncbi:hypothetical protein VULLAG_LOCUS7448 [Vulpes lagopus]